MKKWKTIAVYCLMSLAALMLALSVAGCDKNKKVAETPEHPATTEHPQGEHPQGEHPQGEHPQGEHPKGEHPQGEHPKGEKADAEHPKGEHPAEGAEEKKPVEHPADHPK